MIRPEDLNEQDEQQKLDEARGGDDSFEEDSDTSHLTGFWTEPWGVSREKSLAGVILWMQMVRISLIRVMS